MSDITQFSVFIVQIVWIPRMSICLDEFWIIVSIIQLSDFWVISYEKWKHLKYVFSFQNSIFNGIFVIKLTYPTAMFDKFFDFFFSCETQPQLLKLKTGSELRCKIGSLEKLRYFKWWVISNKNWVMRNYKPTRPLITHF